MAFTVKSVSGPSQKSAREVEEALLKEQEEKNSEAARLAAEAEAEKVRLAEEEAAKSIEKPQLGEADVLKFLKEKYNKDVSSLEEVLKEKEAPKNLPPLVEKYLEYEKATNGRSFEDFMKLQEDVNSKDPDKLLQDYYSATETGLDPDDIKFIMQDKFGYDAELDSESEIKSKELAKKRELAKAKKFFNDSKEAYKVPAASAAPAIPDSELDAYKAYKDYISKSSSIQEENVRKAEYFKQKTEELFSDKFEGFEFKVGEQSIVFPVGDVKTTKEVQSNINNFISKYLDDKGVIKDPVGYHKALSAAMNPEKMAAFFYEKGKADAISGTMKNAKNINYQMKSVASQFSKGGFSVKAVPSSHGSGLKIKSVKKV